jgi:hypothetical protein
MEVVPVGVKLWKIKLRSDAKRDKYVFVVVKMGQSFIKEL